MNAWWPNGAISRWNGSVPCGRAEPAPPRCGPSQLGWPCEGGPGSGAKGGFSEGRTLCVRMARPHKCQGIPFLPLDDARGRWPTGHMSRSTPRLPCGRAEPAPPRSRPSELRWPPGARPGDGVKGGFSEGRTLCVREYGPDASRGIAFAPDDEARGLWPTGHMPRSSRCLPIRACRARPSAESAIRAKMASRCKARGWR